MRRFTIIFLLLTGFSSLQATDNITSVRRVCQKRFQQKQTPRVGTLPFGQLVGRGLFLRRL